MGDLADLDWNDLRYFLAAMRAGSLSGAARNVGVTHSTIGRRLDAFESALGGPLFLRGPDGLRLTSLGERVAPLAEEIERGARTVASLAQAQDARVRLAIPSGLGRLFAARLGGFHRRYPDIVLELLSSSRPVDLRNGEAELAIRMGMVTEQDLVARKVGVSGWSLYASPSYLASHPPPSDPRDLTGHDLLGFEASLERAPGAQWTKEHGSGATIVLRTREMTEMHAAAVSGAGLAILPCLLGDSDPALVRLTTEVLGSHSIFLVYHRNILLSGPVRLVKRFATDVIREHAAALGGAG